MKFKNRHHPNMGSSKLVPEQAIGSVCISAIADAPGYYDRGVDALAPQLEKLAEIVAFLVAKLPEESQVVLATQLGFQAVENNGIQT